MPGLRILSKEEVKEMEPNLTDDLAGALYAPTGGIVCPFGLTLPWRRTRRKMRGVSAGDRGDWNPETRMASTVWRRTAAFMRQRRW